MDEKRRAAGQKLLDAAWEFFNACREEGQRGAVQWVIGSEGEMVIFTRGEYRQTLMSNIDRLADGRVHYFQGEAMPTSLAEADGYSDEDLARLDATADKSGASE